MRKIIACLSVSVMLLLSSSAYGAIRPNPGPTSYAKQTIIRPHPGPTSYHVGTRAFQPL